MNDRALCRCGHTRRRHWMAGGELVGFPRSRWGAIHERRAPYYRAECLDCECELWVAA